MVMPTAPTPWVQCCLGLPIKITFKATIVISFASSKVGNFAWCLMIFPMWINVVLLGERREGIYVKRLDIFCVTIIGHHEEWCTLART